MATVGVICSISNRRLWLPSNERSDRHEYSHTVVRFLFFFKLGHNVDDLEAIADKLHGFI